MLAYTPPSLKLPPSKDLFQSDSLQSTQKKEKPLVDEKKAKEMEQYAIKNKEEIDNNRDCNF